MKHLELLNKNIAYVEEHINNLLDCFNVCHPTMKDFYYNKIKDQQSHLLHLKEEKLKIQYSLNS